MRHSPSHRRTSRRPAFSFLQRALEALESRVLLSGNSYGINVYSFTGGIDGASPYGALVADSQGNLFGTTALGGANAAGAVFELPASGGNILTLYSFAGTPGGANPHAGLTLDASGNLFGVTYGGGANGDGAIFEVPAGAISATLLYSFSGGDGANPYGGLILDPAGNLFGTTVNGGALGQGTVFEFTAGGTFTTLHSFNRVTDGANPYAALLRDSSGNLYGTAWAGGTAGDGTVFEISGGTFQTLKSFTGPDGAKPASQLVMDSQGNIFGLTQAGGTFGDGTLFGIPAGATSVHSLYSFTGGVDGASPYGNLIADASGNFFGTTYLGGAHGKGTVYEIPADSTLPQTLYSFTGGVDGATPYSALLLRGNGNLYGTTTTGGASGKGVIYQLVPTATTQMAVATQPTNITAGAKVTPSVVINLDLAAGGINTADNSSVTLSIVSGPSGGTLSGTTTVQAHNGVATFSNLQLTRAGTYTLAAADGSLAPAVLTSFVVSPGPAARLAYGQQPASLVAGHTISPGVAVDIVDSFGNVVTSNSSTVTVLLQGGSASLSGTLAVPAISGVATFGDLSLTKTGTYTLLASDGHLPALKSAAFIVTPDVASGQLTLLHQPGNTVVGKTLAPALSVSVADQFGNLVTSNTSQVSVSLVVLSLGGNATSATLTGTTTAKLVKGAATFGNLAISQPGSYELQISDGAFTPVTTQPILSFFVPTRLAFTQQPARNATAGASLPAIVVSIEDSSKRIDTTNNSVITLALSGNTNSTISGTLTAQAINGVATFTGLTMDQAGSYVLQATAGTLTLAKSATFTIQPDAATSHLVLATQPADTLVGKPLAPNLVVKAVDQFGNPVPADHSKIILSTTAGTFTGNNTITLNNASATFSNIVFKTAGVYTLTAAPATTSTLADTTPISFSQTILQATTSPIASPAVKAAGYAFGTALGLSITLHSNAPSAIPFTGAPTLVINGTANIPAATFTVAGQVKFTVPVLDVGAYSCQILYAGDVNHASASSATFTLTINPAATTTVLSASPASLVFGQPLTLTAFVKSAASVARPGSIEFLDNGAALQNLPINGTTSSASLTYTPASTGSHSYQAIYLGVADFAASTSSALKRTVNRDKSAVLLTPSGATLLSPNQTFNLTIQASVLAPGAGVLTGDLVTIKDNGKLLGTLTLDSSGAGTLNALTYTASGSHSLTALFAGDPATLASTSAVLKLTVA